MCAYQHIGFVRLLVRSVRFDLRTNFNPSSSKIRTDITANMILYREHLFAVSVSTASTWIKGLAEKRFKCPEEKM